jgi:hypothetical protein
VQFGARLNVGVGRVAGGACREGETGRAAVHRVDGDKRTAVAFNPLVRRLSSRKGDAPTVRFQYLN